jgi:hypothetical protein
MQVQFVTGSLPFYFSHEGRQYIGHGALNGDVKLSTVVNR